MKAVNGLGFTPNALKVLEKRYLKKMRKGKLLRHLMNFSKGLPEA